jgi:hypothetical protein
MQVHWRSFELAAAALAAATRASVAVHARHPCRAHCEELCNLLDDISPRCRATVVLRAFALCRRIELLAFMPEIDTAKGTLGEELLTDLTLEPEPRLARVAKLHSPNLRLRACVRGFWQRLGCQEVNLLLRGLLGRTVNARRWSAYFLLQLLRCRHCASTAGHRLAQEALRDWDPLVRLAASVYLLGVDRVDGLDWLAGSLWDDVAEDLSSYDSLCLFDDWNPALLQQVKDWREQAFLRGRQAGPLWEDPAIEDEFRTHLLYLRRDSSPGDRWWYPQGRDALVAV